MLFSNEPLLNNNPSFQQVLNLSSKYGLQERILHEYHRRNTMFFEDITPQFIFEDNDDIQAPVNDGQTQPEINVGQPDIDVGQPDIVVGQPDIDVGQSDLEASAEYVKPAFQLNSPNEHKDYIVKKGVRMIRKTPTKENNAQYERDVRSLKRNNARAPKYKKDIPSKEEWYKDNIGYEPDPDQIDVVQAAGNKDGGLYDNQIDRIMSRFASFLGCIMRDQIKTILPYVIPKSRMSFIINSDTHDKPGKHWQALYIDARDGPESSNSIEWFDSFARPIPADVLEDLKLVEKCLKPSNILKLKENRIIKQSDESSNCRWFCVSFLIDRYRGKSFSEATGYDDKIKIDDSKHSEKEIEILKHQKPFSYILPEQ